MSTCCWFETVCHTSWRLWHQYDTGAHTQKTFFTIRRLHGSCSDCVLETIRMITHINSTIILQKQNISSRTLYLSKISDLPEEPLFKHSWVHLLCGLGLDRWIWEMGTCGVEQVFSFVSVSKVEFRRYRNWFYSCSFTLVSTQMASIYSKVSKYTVKTRLYHLYLGLKIGKIVMSFSCRNCSIKCWPAGGRTESIMLPWGPAEGHISDNAPSELSHELNKQLSLCLLGVLGCC